MGGTAEPTARRPFAPFTTALALSCACAAASATSAAAADLPTRAAGVDWYTGASQQAVDDSWAVAVDGSTSVTSSQG